MKISWGITNRKTSLGTNDFFNYGIKAQWRHTFLWPIKVHWGPNITAWKLVTLKINRILVCEASLQSANEAACDNEKCKISGNVWF